MELLLAHLLDKDRSWILAHDDYCLSFEEEQTLTRLMERRQNGEPIAYILGHKAFWSWDFLVNEHTLIPRPETELLVETALSTMPETTLQMVDFGTGTGAIAATLKKERPDWQVVATDKSFEALLVAQYNCEHINAHVSLVCADWGSPFRNGYFDLVISNPPYIRADDPCLDSLRSEPLSALMSGEQGLADIDLIINQSRQLLRPSGRLILEHGYDQSPVVCDKMRLAGYSEISVFRDLSGLPRVCTGIRN
ncbi:MAG: peptide chain release factor N(5)-glutamine methyltransferase [Gammaproteobacteria bacterium]|nr:peptide chain release factor N(5)-glutamine methyltransferase [Gammaproteobacteria bacterium]